ncbi:hypothetical protein Vadar_003977 [Vaccinium darrowii]|uniref:Uncharacterized protein n=1 Tax=Vaccinium darrowii TaxID=229202 RepID=A0ACB7YTW7_9ERIC|nr:hypothetical protein Vadar_003977 [Vaccinium darrowii]
MFESPIGSSAHSTNSGDSSGPSQPQNGSPLPSSSPDHPSENVDDADEFCSDQVVEDNSPEAKLRNGLDVIKVGIEKILDSVAYWTASPKREEKFEETVRQMKVSCTKKLGLDCATRWNSTFLMLQTALLYKYVFNHLSKRDSQYQSIPSEEDWVFAKDIRLALRNWLYDENAVVREMVKRMVDKFDKYWAVIHGVVGVSSVLDPRYKLNVLELYFSKLFPESFIEELKKFVRFVISCLRSTEILVQWWRVSVSLLPRQLTLMLSH